MMVNVLSSIRLAVCAFPLLAAPVAVPFFCRQMRARCFNWVRAVFGGLFLFYVLCVLALVFFPLPDAAQAAKLTTYDAQLVPFQFVADFLRETPLVRSDVRTYLPALFDRTVQSGYGKYSAVAFDLEKLKVFDPKGVAEFREEWNLPDKKPVKKKSRGMER